MADSKIVIGIDVGGSTTKIVAFDGEKLLSPKLVKANDPIASVYGGFGKLTSDHNISLKDIDKGLTHTPKLFLQEAESHQMKTADQNHVDPRPVTVRGLPVPEPLP